MQQDDGSVTAGERRWTQWQMASIVVGMIGLSGVIKALAAIQLMIAPALDWYGIVHLPNQFPAITEMDMIIRLAAALVLVRFHRQVAGWLFRGREPFFPSDGISPERYRKALRFWISAVCIFAATGLACNFATSLSTLSSYLLFWREAGSNRTVWMGIPCLSELFAILCALFLMCHPQRVFPAASTTTGVTR